MTRRAAAVALATLSCAEAPTGPTAPNPVAVIEQGPISYTSLAAGEELRVRLHAYGCFHDVAYTLTFRPVSDSIIAVATRQEPQRWFDRRPAIVADTVIGPSELASLEWELADYRRPSENTCTSQSDVELDLYRNGTLVRQERYHRGTCRLFETGPPVTMFSLAYQEYDDGAPASRRRLTTR